MTNRMTFGKEWLHTALQAERSRIDTAQTFLRAICDVFEQYGHKVAIINRSITGQISEATWISSPMRNQKKWSI